MANIVTLTLNPAIDESCSVDRVVAEDKLRCSRPSYDPGGGGINVARVIDTLGGEATAIWTCGGATGRLLGELLDATGIRHMPIEIANLTRQNFIVYEEQSGLQYRFGKPGAELSADEANRCLDAIGRLDPPPDFLVLSGSLPPGVDDDFYVRAVGQVPKDCRVIVDTSGETLRKVLDAGVFLIKPNLRELGQLLGRDVTDDPEIEQAAKEIVAAGKAEVVAVSIGSGGATLVAGELCEHIRSPTVPIRSKVGAGDSMLGGIVWRLSQTGDVHDAILYGVAAGAAAVMTSGTLLCNREDVERLHDQLKRQYADRQS